MRIDVSKTKVEDLEKVFPNHFDLAFERKGEADKERTHIICESVSNSVLDFVLSGFVF